MEKILVADDEIDLEMLIKQKFRRQIRDKKYEFIFALNGNEALEKIKTHPDISIVLSDINMPELDGLALLERLKEGHPFIKTVMVSAYGDMENIRTAMNQGAFDFICKPVNFEDLELTIEKTSHQVHQVKKTLQAIKENNILRMYVDETVLNLMGTKEFEASLMASESIDATIVFIDICGFTAITEIEPADNVVHLLNKYFDVMVKEIIEQKGHIDKFIGDAIMAVFRGEYHLDRAVEASLSVRKEIDGLTSELHSGKFFPKVTVGINSGSVISGNIGSSTLKRLDYTVVGDIVNTAKRLQSSAEAGQIIVTEELFHKLKESFQCRKLGEKVLKNKAAPIVIYEVIG